MQALLLQRKLNSTSHSGKSILIDRNHLETNITCRVTANLVSSTDGSYLFGGKHGIGIAQRDSSEYRYIKRFWNDEEVAKGYENSLRANDGAVDSQGRFWVGTVNDPAVTGGKFDPVGMLELFQFK